MSAALVLPFLPLPEPAARRIRLPRVQAAEARTLHATPEMAFYRKYTEGLLRRYFRMSLESGKVPSLMGRDMFRGHVSSYVIHSFEDAVIFVHDVERSIKQLDSFDQKLIQRIAIQEHTQAEMAAMLGMSERTVMRRYREALDELTAVFLQRKLLNPVAGC